MGESLIRQAKNMSTYEKQLGGLGAQTIEGGMGEKELKNKVVESYVHG